MLLPSVTLGQLKNEFGKDWIIGYIEMWLIDLNDSTNVKNKMNPAQMEFTAERIYDSYSLKVTDLTLFFRNIKEGVYGSYYENLSQDKIMAWLKEYYDLRCEYAELQRGNEHEKFIATKDKMNPKVFKALFDEVGEDEEENKEALKGKGNGIGQRFREMIVRSGKAHMNEIYKVALLQTKEQLVEYLLLNDKDSENFNQEIYDMVEQEVERREKNDIK